MQVIGTLRKTSDGVRLHFSPDLARLLNWFLMKETGMVFLTPKRPAKVSLWSKKFAYKQKYPKSIDKYIGRKYTIDIDPTKAVYLISYKPDRCYWVYFLNIECPVLWSLIKELGVEDSFDARNRPHMTISNSKYAITANIKKFNTYFIDSPSFTD